MADRRRDRQPGRLVTEAPPDSGPSRQWPLPTVAPPIPKAAKAAKAVPATSVRDLALDPRRALSPAPDFGGITLPEYLGEEG